MPVYFSTWYMSKVWLHHQVNELGNLNLFPIFPLFLYEVMFFLFAFFYFLTLLPFPDFFFHSADQWVPRRTGVSNFEFFPLKFRTHDRFMPVIKGTQSAMRPRWPGHYFCQFEKSLPQPEIKWTRRLHLEIRFNLA